ncbi:MAG TPA: sigma-E factor negative regulatory protein [Steroidobacteraceae bacterium]|jgi:sigma-E factor negative regulatory protein RseA|nr:sigma-E factor negative regulatory protein [Steroidobacteraceae bacterium]
MLRPRVTEHMTDALNEQLSACLDGELPPAELDLLLKRLERDPELRQTLGRYTAVGEAMRQPRPAIASSSFAEKVMAAVDQEPAVARRRVRIPPVLLRSLRPVAGIGVAATVAAIAIFSVQQAGVAPGPVASNQASSAPTAVVAQSDDDAASYIVPTNTTQSAFVPATRLTNYVVAHSEYSSPLARRSMLTGVLAEDDGDPDVATTTITDETNKDDEKKSSAQSQ